MKHYYNFKSIATLFIFLITVTSCFSQLSGTYTIGTGGNYTTIASAVNALVNNGVNGPVTFNILSGVYEEIITIDSIPGSSAANNITFQSQTGNRDDVLWRDSVDNPPALITLNGTDHITFKNISFRNAQSLVANQYVFYITLNCEGLSFINNNIISNGFVRDYRFFFNDASIKNLIIEKNLLKGNAFQNSYGIFCNSNTSFKNILILENTFEDITAMELYGSLKSSGTQILGNIINSARAINLNNHDSLLIEKNNLLLSVKLLTAPGGISLTHCDQYFLISKNNIVSQGWARFYPGSGVDINSCICQNSLVANNFIYYVDETGIGVSNSSNINIYFNTILSVSNSQYNPAANIGISKGIQCNVMNNICGGWNAVFNNDSNVQLSSDHNYFQPFYYPYVSMFYYNGIGFPGLNEYRTVSHTDSHSVVEDVFFVSYTDLHLAGTSIGNLSLRGIPIPGITDDIDGDLRDASAPYIGADEADVPLPVELTLFSSTVNGRNVLLSWRTAFEINNSRFEIERCEFSSESHEWQSSGFVNGNGTINSPVDYSFNDRALNSGRYKYRLRQIDYNGSFRFFDLQNDVVIGTPEHYSLSQNYPNPFNPITKIDFSIPNSGVINISMYDVNGREVKILLNEFKEAGYYNIQVNGNELSSGIYFYSIKTDKFVATKKMILLK